MKNCKDCFYYGNCRVEKAVAAAINDFPCFKDKSRFIELPCSIGDKVYTISYQQKVYEAEVICIRPFVFKDHIEYRGNVIIIFEDPFYHDGRSYEQELFVVFGKDTFLTREEAEKKLEELK